MTGPSERPTIGQVIDGLGVRVYPEHRNAIETATKAVIILAGEGRFPEVMMHMYVVAGDLNVAEAVGLLEITRQGMTSPRAQREGMQRLLSGEPPEEVS